MEKENLDDLMREKFDTDDPGARFEFREEYWEQAQAMLEADERKRKRRFLWWWWLGAGCLLLAVGGWFAYAGQSGGSALGIEQTIEQSTTGEVSNAQTANELDKNTDGSGTNIIESSKANAPTDQSATKGAATADDTPAAAGNQVNRNSPAAQSDQADASARGSATGRAKTADGTQTEAENRANRNTPAAQSGRAGAAAGSKSLTRRDGQQPKSSGLLPATTTTTAITSQPTGLPVGSTTATIISQPTGLPVGNTTATPQPTDLPAADAPKISPMLVLQKLPLLDFQALTTPPYIPFFPKAPQAAREIKPLREPRLGIGVGASVAALFPKNSALQVGSTAGIFTDYRLSRSFSLSAGAAWRYIPMGGILADSVQGLQVSEQLRYSFGYKQLRTSIRPQGLHTLELPLTLRWHRGAWHLEGGASVSRLLGVRADMVTDSSASLQPLTLTAKKKIWTDTEPYRQMWLSPMAGAGWQRGRWSVSLRAVLFPLDVVPPEIPDKPRATGWRPSVDIGLRYRIW